MRLRPRNNQADRVLARSISLRITACGPRIRVPRTSKPEPSNGFAKPCVARRLLALTPQKNQVAGHGNVPGEHHLRTRVFPNATHILPSHSGRTGSGHPAPGHRSRAATAASRTESERVVGAQDPERGPG